jgi:hypothetical protein
VYDRQIEGGDTGREKDIQTGQRRLREGVRPIKSAVFFSTYLVNLGELFQNRGGSCADGPAAEARWKQGEFADTLDIKLNIHQALLHTVAKSRRIL